MKPDRSWVRARAQFVATAVLAVVMSALLLFPQNAFAAPAASPAAGAARGSGATFSQMTHYVYEATNQVRYDAGLSTGYARDARLDKVAMAWAQQQWKNGAMSHNPNYSTQIPGGWQRAGENVASGYTYTQVVPAWVASPSHYANLVRDYTSIGIGYYEADGRRYWVQTFAKYPGTTVPKRPAAPSPAAPSPAPTTPAPASGYPAEPAPPAGAVIALRSPSFEGGSAGWSGGAGVEGPTTAARGGRYDLKATGGTVSQSVSLAPRVGETYTATIWVKPGGSARISGSLRLVASGGTSETARMDFSVGGGWTRVSVPLTIARSGHTALRLEVSLNRGDIRLDAASLVRTGNAPASKPAPAPAPSTPPAPSPTPSSGGGLLSGLLGAAPPKPAPKPAPAPAQPPAPKPTPTTAPAPAPAPSGGLLGGLLGGLGL